MCCETCMRALELPTQHLFFQLRESFPQFQPQAIAAFQHEQESRNPHTN
jgi:hypothetical protein